MPAFSVLKVQRQTSSQRYEYIEVRPIVCALGAEIGGVDLTRSPSEEVFREILKALFDREVVFFHDQDLTPEQHLDFARRFGRVEPHHYYPHLPELPEISVLEPEANAPLNLWHTDGSYRRSPPIGAVLHAQQVPSCGGDTLWASLTAAYEALSSDMKTLLENLEARHDARLTYEESILKRPGGAEKLRQSSDLMRSVVHPVIRTHPATGRKALFVNPNYVSEIVGLPHSDSDALLAQLFHHQQLPEFQLRFRWREKSLAVWDNRVTMHYAVQDYHPQYRKMHRVVISEGHPGFVR